MGSHAAGTEGYEKAEVTAAASTLTNVEQNHGEQEVADYSSSAKSSMSPAISAVSISVGVASGAAAGRAL